MRLSYYFSCAFYSKDISEDFHGKDNLQCTFVKIILLHARSIFIVKLFLMLFYIKQYFLCIFAVNSFPWEFYS